MSWRHWESRWFPSQWVNRLRKVSLHALTSFHWFSAYEISIFCNLVWWRFMCSIVLKMYVVFYSTLHSEMMVQVHERQGLFILQSARWLLMPWRHRNIDIRGRYWSISPGISTEKMRRLSVLILHRHLFTHCGRVTQYGNGSMLCKNPIFFTMK